MKKIALAALLGLGLMGTANAQSARDVREVGAATVSGGAASIIFWNTMASTTALATAGVGVGVGAGAGVGVGVGVGSAPDGGVAAGRGSATPLFQRSFLPLFTQVNLKPLDIETCPAFVQGPPGFTVAPALLIPTVRARVRAAVSEIARRVRRITRE